MIDFSLTLALHNRLFRFTMETTLLLRVVKLVAIRLTTASLLASEGSLEITCTGNVAEIDSRQYKNELLI